VSDETDSAVDGRLPERWEPRPIPEVTPESAAYWRGASEGELRLSECPECGLVFHYPRALCPDCFADTEWTVASGRGTVYSYSVARRMSGWPETDLPMVLGYVELEEGPRVMTTVVADPEDVCVGTEVEVRFVPTDDEDVAVPVFVLA
jgi:hypothetical protein